MTMPLLHARNLARHFLGRGGVPALKAVDGVSFALAEGSTLGIAGESGSGKSTLARLVMALDRPTAGEVVFAGQDLFAQPPQALARLRRGFQMVFQDPYGSLDPRMSVGRIVAEPLHLEPSPPGGAARRQRVAEVLSEVGLAPADAERRPHQFSGGQRQRIAIARALISRPRLVVADEPVSALDLSVQAQVLNLLMDLQEELKLAYLFISHDLSVVRHIADEVMVMYLGRPVEQGDKETIFERPRHPYTRALLASTPSVDPKARSQRATVRGELPSPINPPSGCAFHRRCSYARPDCATRRPELRRVDGRLVACHYAESIG